MKEQRTERRIQITEGEAAPVKRRKGERKGNRRREGKERRKRRGRRQTVIYLSRKKRLNPRKRSPLNLVREDESLRRVRLQLLRTPVLNSPCQQLSSCVNSMV